MKLVLKFQTPIENHWTAASVGTHCGSLWSCSTTQWWLTDRQAGRRTGRHVQVFICASTYIWQIEKKKTTKIKWPFWRAHTHTHVSLWSKGGTSYWHCWTWTTAAWRAAGTSELVAGRNENRNQSASVLRRRKKYFHAGSHLERNLVAVFSVGWAERKNSTARL